MPNSYAAEKLSENHWTKEQNSGKQISRDQIELGQTVLSTKVNKNRI